MLVLSQSKEKGQRQHNEDLLKQFRAADTVSSFNFFADQSSKQHNFINMLMMVVNADTHQQLNPEDDTGARTLASILFKNTMFQNVFGGSRAVMQNSVWF